MRSNGPAPPYSSRPVVSSDATGWVYRHSPYTGVTFQVHHAVADSVNDQNGNEFWLTKARCADKARVTPKSVQRSLASLVEDGFLEVLKESTGREATRYRFLFPEVPVVYEARWQPSGTPRPRPSTGTPEDANGDMGDQQRGHQFPKTPRIRNEPKRTQEEPNGDDLLFETFWRIFPSKAKKPDAKRAWQKAVRKATVGVITAAAIRYRDDPNRDDAYTAYAASWLNSERWNDPPLPPRKDQRRSAPPSQPASLTPQFDTEEEFEAWRASQ